MSLSELVLPANPVLDDVRGMAGALVIDHYGALAMVADYGNEDLRKAWTFAFGGDNAFVLFAVNQRARALNLDVDKIEIVAKGLAPAALGHDSALGKLYINEDGASIVVKDAADGGLLLFNVNTKRSTSLPHEARLATDTWRLRAYRDKKVAFEYEVNAYAAEYAMHIVG